MSYWLVVGGGGYYGAKVVEALERRGVKVVVGSRHPAGRPGAIRVDLADRSTYPALRDCRGVVNCADSVGAPPDDAIDFVLRGGGVWLEMGADAPTLERLAARTAQDAKGTVVLGVGIFPGLSTALARHVAEAGASCTRLELGIRLSALSGAGPANCALMAESLFVPAYWIRDGRREQARSALGGAAPLPFDDGVHTAVRFALPDTALMARAIRAGDLSASMALIPGWMRFNFALLAALAAFVRHRIPSLRGALTTMLAWQLRLVRATLLRRRHSPVQLVALADRGLPTERSASLRFADGQRATAEGVAAAVMAWEARTTHPAGLFGAAELFELPSLLEFLLEAPAFERRGAWPSDAGGSARG